MVHSITKSQTGLKQLGTHAKYSVIQIFTNLCGQAALKDLSTISSSVLFYYKAHSVDIFVYINCTHV